MTEKIGMDGLDPKELIERLEQLGGVGNPTKEGKKANFRRNLVALQCSLDEPHKMYEEHRVWLEDRVFSIEHLTDFCALDCKVSAFGCVRCPVAARIEAWARKKAEPCCIGGVEMSDELKVGDLVYTRGKRLMSLSVALGYSHNITSETDSEWIMNEGTRRFMPWPKEDKQLRLFSEDSRAMYRIGDVVTRLLAVDAREIRPNIDGIVDLLEAAVALAKGGDYGQ